MKKKQARNKRNRLQKIRNNQFSAFKKTDVKITDTNHHLIEDLKILWVLAFTVMLINTFNIDGLTLTLIKLMDALLVFHFRVFPYIQIVVQLFTRFK